MAQIIKHRRGSLESVQGATKRAGELLVVTGSTGITADNGDSLLFIGIDGSTVTPANKVLQGSSVPDLSGASYDTSIDGIPYYDTSANKLYILNKAGNVEVKATANTGGTGIVSGSSQITSLLPAGTVSGSSQVTISDTTGYTSFSSSLDGRLVTLSTKDTELFTTASDHEGRIDTIETSLGGGGSLGTRVTNLETFSGSQETKDSTLATYTGSVDSKFSTLATYTGSVDSKFSTLATYTGSVNSDLSTLHSFTSSQEAKDSTLATYTGSVNSKFSTLATYTASVDNSITSLNAVSHSHSNKSNLDTIDQDLATTSVVEFSSLKTSGTGSIGTNLTIYGNLTVWGTQSIINSENLAVSDNMIYLNNGSEITNPDLGIAGNYNDGTYAHSGIFSDASDNHTWKVYKGYTPEPSGAIDTSHGSFALADFKAGVFTGTSFNGTINATNGVVSGSSQITISSTTGYTDFSSSIATAISASTAGSTWENLNGKPGGIVSSSVQVVDYLDGENVNLGGISGSSLDITGNAKIDGNVVIGGNITVGDADTDTVSFSADLTSDILVGTDNTYDLGSSSKGFANVYATNLYGTINGSVNATNGVISGSSQVNADSITNFDTNVKDKLNADTVVSGSAQVIALLPTGVVSGSSQLNNTTISGATLTSVQASGSFSGSFQGDGSSLTGIASTLALSGSTGNDTINLKTEALLVTGSNGISTNVASNTVTISGVDASTSNKGVASFSSDDFSVSTGNVSIKDGGVRAINLNSDVAGTGISLNVSDNTIEVDFGSTSGTAVEGDTSLVVQGTSNEIEVTNGSVTLGTGGTVTVGLPNSVTIQTGSIAGDLSVGRDLTVTGNLFVEGTTTTVDSTTIQLGDNIIELNGSGAANGGLLIKDVTNPNTASGSLLWDSTNDYWKGGALGSEKQFARLNATPTSGSVLVISENGLLVDSDISDNGTFVTIGNDLVINGIDASAFLYSDSNKSISSIVPSNAGDIIQWNGSSFVASNTIDGGTF